MKKQLFFLLLLCLCGELGFGQLARYCEDFQHSSSLTNWGGPGVTVSHGKIGPAGLGDKFLKVTDQCGHSRLQNRKDFEGDWHDFLGSCFCFDFRAINTGSGSPAVTPRIRLIGSGGLVATFHAHTQVNERDPWVSLCAPIELCTGGLSGGTLPSNADGYWTINQAANPCHHWSDLLNSVEMVEVAFDYTSSCSETIGLDNICIRDCNGQVPPQEGAFCCEGENLIRNGNFEAGDIGFDTDYRYEGGKIFPGNYAVVPARDATEACETWRLKDHSACAGFGNDHVLLVNGATQQSGSSTIWSQTISGLDPDKTYQFCGYAKHLPVCCFDVTPRISVGIEGSAGVPGYSYPINTNATDPCDWKEFGWSFSPSGTSVTINIDLQESFNGDGNDLALDDIALIEVVPAVVPLSAQIQSYPHLVAASIGNSGSGDDANYANTSCRYEWTVAEVISFDPLVLNTATLQSFGPPHWNLTTNFPGYDFEHGKLYYIGLKAFDCDCAGDNENFVLTYINSPHGIIVGETEYATEELEELIQTFYPSDMDPDPVWEDEGREEEDEFSELGKMGNNIGASNPSGRIEILPNPSRGFLNISVDQGTQTFQLSDLNGKVLENWEATGRQTFDLSSHPAGIYFLRYQDQQGFHTEKILLNK